MTISRIRVKFAVSIAGFMIFIGVVMLGMFSLTALGIIYPEFLNEEARMILVWMLLILGCIDILAGIIFLWR